MLGVNLVESNSSEMASSGVAEWGFFGETNDPKITPESMMKALKQTPGVLECRVRGAHGKVIVDTLHYPIRVSSGHSAILIRKEVFGNMLKFVVQTYGSGGQALAYQLGRAAGESDGMDLIHELGPERLLENLPELTNLYMAQGWGIPDLTDLSINPLSATVRLDDCFECTQRTSLVPTSHFVRGHLAGLGGAFFDKMIECVEKKCIAKGDRYCEFLATETYSPRLGTIR
jgi:predicted hydrocarbon binding protein